MTIMNLMIGFPTMLLCLIVQVVVSFWAVRYYVRQSSDVPVPHRFVAGIRPLLIIMLVMMFGNFVQIAVWEPFSSGWGVRRAIRSDLPLCGQLCIVGLWRHRHEQGLEVAWPARSVNGVLMLGMSAAALMAYCNNSSRRSAAHSRGMNLHPRCAMSPTTSNPDGRGGMPATLPSTIR